jgi:hypothetical protein
MAVDELDIYHSSMKLCLSVHTLLTLMQFLRAIVLYRHLGGGGAVVLHSVLPCSSPYGLKHEKEGKRQVLPRMSLIFVCHMGCSLLKLCVL